MAPDIFSLGLTEFAPGSGPLAMVEVGHFDTDTLLVADDEFMSCMVMRLPLVETGTVVGRSPLDQEVLPIVARVASENPELAEPGRHMDRDFRQIGADQQVEGVATAALPLRDGGGDLVNDILELFDGCEESGFFARSQQSARSPSLGKSPAEIEVLGSDLLEAWRNLYRSTHACSS